MDCGLNIVPNGGKAFYTGPFFISPSRGVSMKTAVIALGGNALLKPEDKGTYEEQMRNVKESARHLASIIEMGYDVIFTHGNGPQVGNILLQNEISAKQGIPSMPLDVCVAESQGLIGYMIQQALTNELMKRGINRRVTSLIVQVVVDENDPAFQNPTKPIGPFYSEEEAKKLMSEKGWTMVEDRARGGWRRVVPSPKPIDIVEKEAIVRLIFGKSPGEIIIAAGGGGIPVIRTSEGYRGVDAVIDKDRASALLAKIIGERLFIILTAVDHVYINYGKEDEKPLNVVTLDEIRRYYEEGQFPPGSMGPKIEAAMDFLENGGEEVIITSPENLEAAIRKKKGTHILRE
jgi:carbamate kinase